MLSRILLGVAVLGLASGLAAHADTIGTTETFHLTVDGCSGMCGSAGSDFGTITLVQSATGVVTVTEVLNSALNPAFVDTGAGESLVFSLTGNPMITIGNLTTGFQRVPTADLNNGPFGTGEYAVTCGGYGTGQSKVGPLSCGPGASTTISGDCQDRFAACRDWTGSGAVASFAETAFHLPCRILHRGMNLLRRFSQQMLIRKQICGKRVTTNFGLGVAQFQNKRAEHHPEQVTARSRLSSASL